MNEIRATHRQAMDLAEAALVARHRGQEEEVRRLYREAMVLEVQAAGMVRDDLEAEPTRGVLYRSAASLAQCCGEGAIAAQLAWIGLHGNPPTEIAAELREVLTVEREKAIDAFLRFAERYPVMHSQPCECCADWREHYGKVFDLSTNPYESIADGIREVCEQLAKAEGR
jgi:hypothetical protein